VSLFSPKRFAAYATASRPAAVSGGALVYFGLRRRARALLAERLLSTVAKGTQWPS